MWKFLKELKIDLPYNPAIALLGIYPKDTDAVKCLHPNVYSSNVHNSQTVEGASVSTERRMNKEDVEWNITVHNGNYVQWNITQPLEMTNTHHLLQRG